LPALILKTGAYHEKEHQKTPVKKENDHYPGGE